MWLVHCSVAIGAFPTAPSLPTEDAPAKAARQRKKKSCLAGHLFPGLVWLGRPEHRQNGLGLAVRLEAQPGSVAY